MKQVIGIDEVGRGCWAGPLLVVAARQIGDLPTSLKDSKLLTKKKREFLYYDIEISCDIGEGWVDPAEIDKLGLSGAMYLAVKRSLLALNANKQEPIIMDGKFNYCPHDFKNVQCVVKADSIYPIVSAASVYAKVKRDRYMSEVSKEYPNYKFDKHVGYGTKLHSDLLKQFGITPLHRVSFAPIKSMI